MYDVGILGGMGAMATKVLFEMIVDNTVVEKDQDHLDVVIANKASIPDRTAFLLDRTAQNPLPALKEGINELNSLSPRMIIIPCNSSHYFIEELQKESQAPLLNMIQNALEYIVKSGLPENVVVLGTLGTVKMGLYDRFNSYGLNIKYPKEEECATIHELIYLIKNKGKEGFSDCADALLEIIEDIKARSEYPLTFILGCTELSVLNEYVKSKYVVDAMKQAALTVINLLKNNRNE